jgi:hypothetical protein
MKFVISFFSKLNFLWNFLLFISLLLSNACKTISQNSTEADFGIKNSSGNGASENENDGTGNDGNTTGPDLLKYSGDLQVVNISALAPIEIGVLALDQEGLPLANVPVSFSVFGGDSKGTLSASSAITNVSGIAQVTFTAGTFIGSVSISAISAYGAQTFTITTVGLTGYSLDFHPASSGNGQTSQINSNLPQQFRVILKDSDGNPVPNTLIRFLSGGGNVGNFSGEVFVDVQTNATGQAIAPIYTLSSGQGIHTIRARVLNDPSVFRDFNVTATVPSSSVIDPSMSTLQLSTTSVDADGMSVVNFILSLRDIYGNLIPNNTYGNFITLTPDPGWLDGSLNSSSWSYSGTGTYSNSLSVGNTPGSISLAASVNGVTLTSNIDTLNIVPNLTIDLTTTTISSTTSPLTADGLSTSTIIVTLRNSLGQNLEQSGHTLVLSTSSGTLLGSAIYHSASKTYRQTLRAPISTGGGSLVVTLVSVDGTPVVGKTTIINLNPGSLVLSNSSIEIPNRMVATTSTGQTITVYLRDASNNLVDLSPAPTLNATITGVSGTLRGTLSNSGLLTRTSTGTYTITLTSPSSVASCTVSPFCVDSLDIKITHSSVNGGTPTSIGLAKKVQWGMSSTQSNPSGILTMPTTIAPAGLGASSLTATLQLTNNLGQLIQVGGQASSISAVASFSTPAISILDNDNGTYSIVVPSPAVGSVGTLTVTSGGFSVTNGVQSVKFYGTPSVAQSSLTLSSASLNGAGSVDIQLTLKDSNGTSIPTLALNDTEVRFTENGETTLVGANPAGAVVSAAAVYSQQVSRSSSPTIGFENVNISAEIFIGGSWNSVSSTTSLNITPPNLSGVIINCTNINSYRNTNLYVHGGTLSINSSVNGTLDNSGSCAAFLPDHPFTFSSVTISSTGKLTHSGATTTIGHGLDIKVNGTININAGGSIDASEKGYLGSQGTGLAYTVGPSNASGVGSNAGGSYAALADTASNSIYGSLTDPSLPGSGGLACTTSPIKGGNGGGLIRLEANNIINNGGILADGGIGYGGTNVIGCNFGAGSGGGIKISVASGGKLQGSGVIKADGAQGYNRNPGNPLNAVDSYSGSGGRIAIYGDWSEFPLENISLLSKNVNATTTTSMRLAKAGTLYLDEKPIGLVKIGTDIRIDDQSNSSFINLTDEPIEIQVKPGAILGLRKTAGHHLKSLNVQGDLLLGVGNIEVDDDINTSGNIVFDSGAVLVHGDFIQTSGTISHVQPMITYPNLIPRVDLTANNITITNINASGLGLTGALNSAWLCSQYNYFSYTSSSNFTIICASATGQGANHYTSGGNNSTFTYGNPNYPFTYGEGGRYLIPTISGASGGGGIVRLMTPGQLNIMGQINVSGQSSTVNTRSGGAGGSIYINAGQVTSSNNMGSLLASAGSTLGTYGSAGGLIRVYTPSALFSGTINTSVSGSTGTSGNGSNGVYTISACASPFLELGYCE